MFSFVLFEDTVHDVEAGFADHDVVMDQVVGEDGGGSEKSTVVVNYCLHEK